MSIVHGSKYMFVNFVSATPQPQPGGLKRSATEPTELICLSDSDDEDKPKASEKFAAPPNGEDKTKVAPPSAEPITLESLLDSTPFATRGAGGNSNDFHEFNKNRAMPQMGAAMQNEFSAPSGSRSHSNPMDFSRKHAVHQPQAQNEMSMGQNFAPFSPGAMFAGNNDAAQQVKYASNNSPASSTSSSSSIQQQISSHQEPEADVRRSRFQQQYGDPRFQFEANKQREKSNNKNWMQMHDRVGQPSTSTAALSSMYEGGYSANLGNGSMGGAGAYAFGAQPGTSHAQVGHLPANNLLGQAVSAAGICMPGQAGVPEAFPSDLFSTINFSAPFAGPQMNMSWDALSK
jgi:hypothetical protein